jgi:hypothetical protein
VMVLPTAGTGETERPTHIAFNLNFADELRRKTR